MPKLSPDLTQRQDEIFEFIVEFFIEHMYWPCYRDISGHFGVTIKAIRDSICSIARKGFLIQPRNNGNAVIARAFVLTDKGLRLVNEIPGREFLSEFLDAGMKCPELE